MADLKEIRDMFLELKSTKLELKKVDEQQKFLYQKKTDLSKREEELRGNLRMLINVNDSGAAYIQIDGEMWYVGSYDFGKVPFVSLEDPKNLSYRDREPLL